MKTIAVVLAVHNRKSLTERFLETMTNQSFNDYKIVLVDDGSTDGTTEMVKQRFPDVHVIQGDGSWWWSASTNKAVFYAIHVLKAKFICTVNDDTEVDFFFLESLHQVAVQKSKSIIGCFSYDIFNRTNLLYDGSCINWFTGNICTLNSITRKSDGQVIIPVTYYIGRGVLIPSDVFIECGYYDNTNFPQSWADNNLIFRAKRKGYRVYATQRAKQFIYANESTHLKLRQNKNWRSYINYLFVNQGGGNVVTYAKYVIKTYPWYGVPMSLVNGILGRFLGYWKLTRNSTN